MAASDDLGRIEKQVLAQTADLVSHLREAAMRAEDSAAAAIIGAARGPMESLFAFKDAVQYYRDTSAQNARQLLADPHAEPAPLLPPIVRAIGTLNKECVNAADAVREANNAQDAQNAENSLQRVTAILAQLVSYLKADAGVQDRRAEAARQLAIAQQEAAQEHSVFEAKAAQEAAARELASAELAAQRRAFVAERQAQADRAYQEQQQQQQQQQQQKQEQEQQRRRREEEEALKEAEEAAEKAAAEAEERARLAEERAAAARAKLDEAAARQAKAYSAAKVAERVLNSDVDSAGGGDDDTDGAFLLDTDDLVSDLLMSLESGGVAEAAPPKIASVIASASNQPPTAAVKKPAGQAPTPNRAFGPKVANVVTAAPPKAVFPKAAGPKATGPKPVTGPKVAGPKATGAKAAGPKVGAPGRLRDSVVNHAGIAGAVGGLKPGAQHPKLAAAAAAKASSKPLAPPVSAGTLGEGSEDASERSTTDAVLDDMLGWLDEQRAQGESSAAPKRSNRPAGAVSTVFTKSGAGAAASREAPAASQKAPTKRLELERSTSFKRQSAALDSMLDDILSTVDVSSTYFDTPLEISNDELMNDLLGALDAKSQPAPAAKQVVPSAKPSQSNLDVDADALMDDLLGSLGVDGDGEVPLSTDSFAKLAQRAQPSSSAAVESSAELKVKIDRLQMKKEEAVRNENFPLAASLKSSIDELQKKFITAQAAEAASMSSTSAPASSVAASQKPHAEVAASSQAADQADQAAAEQLAMLRSQVDSLHKQKNAAVDAEDFPTAQRLKIEIDELESLLREGSLLVGGTGNSNKCTSSSSDDSEFTSFLAAIRSSDSVRVTQLLEGPKCDFFVSYALPASGETALHAAVNCCAESMCKALVSSGADPNHLSVAGVSPMHLVIRKRYADDPSKQNTFDSLTKFFIEKGAGDLYLEPEGGGKTPLEEAEASYQKELQAFLSQLHAKYQS